MSAEARINWPVEVQNGPMRDLDTPFYLYSLDELRARVLEFQRTVPTMDRVFFAMMANYNRDVLRAVNTTGIGFFCQGIEHIDWAIRCGAKRSDIVCACTNLSERECRGLGEREIFSFANSIAQFRRLRSYNPNRVGVRINAGEMALWAKLPSTDPAVRIGVSPAEIIELPREEKRQIKALHIYAGTNLPRDEWYLALVASAYRLASQLPECEAIDIGGGFGVGYDNPRYDFDLAEFDLDLKALRSTHREELKCRLWCEPGRHLVARCGVMVTTVTDIIERGGVRYIGVDTSATSFPRHLINMASGAPVAVLGRESSPALTPAVICGSTTYSDDFLTARIELGRVEIGERLVFLLAGAYQYSMAMDFLGRTRPAEYIIERGQVTLSRLPSLPAGFGGFVDE